MTRIVRAPASRLTTNRAHTAAMTSHPMAMAKSNNVRSVNGIAANRVQQPPAVAASAPAAARRQQLVTSLNSRTPLLGSSSMTVTTSLVHQSPRDAQHATNMLMESLSSWYQQSRDASSSQPPRPGSRRKAYRMKAMQVSS